LHRKSSLVSSNPSIDSSSTTNKNNNKTSLSSTSTKTDLHEIFELDKLINNLSLSKSNTEQMNNEIENYECIDINNDNDDDDDDDDDDNEHQQDVAVLSVKEQAKKINRLSTKSDLRNDLTPKLRKNSSSKELEINKVNFSTFLNYSFINITNIYFYK
jgi:hypothetical protein